jgi:hypothetical protein
VHAGRALRNAPFSQHQEKRPEKEEALAMKKDIDSSSRTTYTMNMGLVWIMLLFRLKSYLYLPEQGLSFCQHLELNFYGHFITYLFRSLSATSGV